MADDKKNEKIVHKANADRIVEIPLKEVLADYQWNARNLGDAVNVETTRKLEGKPEDGEGPDGSRGVPGLIQSIITRGQKIEAMVHEARAVTLDKLKRV